MKYINLENIDIVELYNVFLKVFGDYKLEFTMSLEQFKSLLKRGCYSSKYSFGMIDDEKIVGIMLNGYKNKYGIKESYGIAAGIIPEYRNKGGSALAFMKSCFKKIEESGISNFKCEILRDNSPALAIMKRFGGYQNKKLVDYRIEIQKLREEQAVCEGLTIERENGFDFLPKYNIAEGDLSWQNSVESLSGMLQDFCIITVTLEREFVGYGVINIFQGDIPQLYIAEAYRHKNIGSWLIHELVKFTQSKYTSFYGIDENRDLVNNFIIKNGFDIYSKQYELIKKISS